MNLKRVLSAGLACLGSCWLSQAHAGGSVVNNGAGIVEQNFQFAYVSIEKLSAECVQNNKCNLSPIELNILKKISVITTVNLFNPKKIQFVSEKNKPGFFTTGPSENNRIAKTALNSKASIYVNRDMLYAGGIPALNLPAIVAILTHELGHQTGELNHEILDTLGAKLRLLLEQNSLVYKINASEKADLKVSITVYNHDYPSKTGELLVNWGNVYSRSLTQNISEKLDCSSPMLNKEGYEITNGHFIYIENETEVGFNALVNVFCRSTLTSDISVEKRDLTFYINKLSNLRDFRINYWWGF